MTDQITATQQIDAQTIDPAAYSAATTGAGIVDSGADLLRVGGGDRVDFIQRMTTNDIAKLQPGGSCVTVLTSPTARIKFTFTVICRAEDFLLLPAPGQADSLYRYLRAQIFFMDDVQVEDQSDETQRLRLIGPKAAETLQQTGVDVTELAADAWQEAAGLTVLSQQAYDLPGYEVMGPRTQVADLQTRLQAAGAAQIDPATYHARRVELGRPAVGAELTEEVTPLEAGLDWTCAENKGCYTGQEIIARQVTYGKVTKTLVGLRSAELPAPGSTVMADGKKAGVVTSAAYSPTLESPLALAIVKRPHNTAGAEVTVDDHPAQVVDLPAVD